MKNDSQEYAQQLQARCEKSRAEFLAGVSHDLKTYLNPIVGFTSVLLQDDEGLKQEQRNQLGLISDSARRLLQRLDALVEFQRLAAGLITVSADWFSPKALLLELAAAHADRARAGRTDLRSSTGPGLARIKSDYRLVRRVIDELLANAVKAAGRGVVSIEANRRPAKAEGSLIVVFRVQDSGAGLDAAGLQRLKSSLAESDGVAAEGFTGLGLGLALSREAARKLGAKIEVQSIQGVGSTFELQLELGAQDVEG